MMDRKDFIERRKQIRFKVRDDAFVSIKSEKDKIGPILNISSDGFAFMYIGKEDQIYGPLEVDLVLCWLRSLYAEGKV